MKEATAGNIAKVLLEHVIIPFGTPREFLTDRGSKFLSKGLLKFLDASNISKLNTSGYHPQSNGKNERYNGILKAAIFRLNKSGDPSLWELVLPAALFSTRIHASDSSGFSPFELTYGISPPLASNKSKTIAQDAVCPGADELCQRIKQINDN
jgi:transposase InsO family protein